MIDIHCHLLPGIDDGPDTLEQALELARLATDNGITHSVVTPHIHSGRWENSCETIKARFESFKRAVWEADIPLQLGYSAEVRLGPEVIKMVTEEQIPFLGEVDGYKILLLELPHSHVPPGSENLTKWLLDHKIRPMIAHPERNKGIMRNLEHIQAFVDQGCFFQMTAGAVAGTFGEPARKTAEALLRLGCCTVIASDAHNVNHRPPRLDHGREAAAAILGTELANALVCDAPMNIVSKQFA